MFQVKWKIYCLRIVTILIKHLTVHAKYRVGLSNFQKYIVSNNCGLPIR